MNLVVGATGLVGGEVCRLLAAAGKPVRALVRPTAEPAKVTNLAGLGIEIAEGDLRDRASLERACRGVTAVITTASATPPAWHPPENTLETVDLDGQISLIDAARAAGVAHVIYVSFTMDADFPLRNAKRSVEQHLKQSGLTYTILRPSYFMEAWLSPLVGFDFPHARATIYGQGHNPISWISLYDVVRFAVACIDHSAARNTTLELGGPEALSPLDVIRLFEEIGGRPFEVQHVPEAALRAQLAGAADALQQSFAGLMLCYAAGDPIDMRATLQAVPLQLTSIQDYARRVLTT
ncbi:MAG TPA: SDR family oxidoreductase [Roseiflexaceae bacterium]|nr:SDR family oxidoreductase [Roseiflexaceae bacterium]